MSRHPTYDLCVIGGGIVGTCVAWYARKKYPKWHIKLLDRSLVGLGASNYAASLDIPFGHSELKRELTRNSRSYYKALREELPELPIEDLIVYGFASQNQTSDILGSAVESNIKAADDQELQTLMERWPMLHLPPKSTLIKNILGSRAIKNEVAQLLAQNFSYTMNSWVEEGSEVKSVVKEGSHYTITTKQDHIHTCSRVVEAIGPWIHSSPQKDQWVANGVRIKKVIAFHIDRPAEKGDPVFMFFNDDAFLLPQPEQNRWLFSIRCDTWDVLPEVSHLSIEPSDVSQAKEILTRYAPDWTPYLSGGRTFCDAYLPSGNPLISEIDQNYVIVGAGGGSGYRLAPGLANQALAQLTSSKNTFPTIKEIANAQ